MIKKLLIGVLMSTSIAYATNNSIDLNVNSNTIELSGEYNLNSVYELNNDARYSAVISYLGTEAKNKSDNPEKLFRAGFKVMNPYMNDIGLSFGLGMQALFINDTKNTFMALPINLFATLHFNEDITIDAFGAYAPKTLSIGDTINMKFIDAKLSFKLIENAHLYVGKRFISSEHENGTEIELDTNPYVGLKVIF